MGRPAGRRHGRIGEACAGLPVGAKTEVIDPHGLTVAAAAKVLGVSRPALSTFLNGRSGLSGIMALRIEKAFGVEMDTLMRMQASYDIARTRQREGEINIEPYLPSADLAAR